MFLEIARAVKIHVTETATSSTHATVSSGSRANSSRPPAAASRTSGIMVVQSYPCPGKMGGMHDERADLAAKKRALEACVSRLERVVVAYSGGVDSTFLAATAHDVLGPSALAVTADSPSVARRDLESAGELAERYGWRHTVVRTREIESERYARNSPDRCYWCKTELLDVLGPIARSFDAAVAVGTNADDLADHRPGRKAAAERGVETPLADAGLTKQDVRALSRDAGLPTADRPASPCLASRFAYGVRVTREGLARIEGAEHALRSLGFDELRVRDHGDLARIEVPPSDVAEVAVRRDAIAGALRELGFVYVTLDLVGFRSGSLNEALPTPRLRARP